jgi:hypothetical protein
MKDDRGPFYYPFPQNKRVRMYVKEDEGTIWFRLYNADVPELWDEHGWVPWKAVKMARELYEQERKSGQRETSDFDPRTAYDIDVAKMILKESG